ncbi:hypothetical protein BpHYR1_004901 [Brachionus plicatilis]|uniref:Uncharacterized protein n=1 Tax=Brachionus plicatilis TaxID=10195 RepID=A0A3M7RQJ9_BRAPC|nr:hypothetical protein BpHYR1_004901 [Brachionus plicatilis]
MIKSFNLSKLNKPLIRLSINHLSGDRESYPWIFYGFLGVLPRKTKIIQSESIDHIPYADFTGVIPEKFMTQKNIHLEKQISKKKKDQALYQTKKQNLRKNLYSYQKTLTPDSKLRIMNLVAETDHNRVV